jgi:hypothetical protein
LKSTTAAALIGFVIVLTASIRPTNAEPGSWSEIVNGVQGRLSISKGERLNGSQLTNVYLELRNVSSAVEIYYEYDRSILSCEVIDAKGSSVRQAADVLSILYPAPSWLVLPFDSSLRFQASVSGYGIPKDSRAVIQMPCGFWALEHGDGDYFLQVIISAWPRDEDRGHQAWHGTLSLPRAPIPN